MEKSFRSRIMGFNLALPPFTFISNNPTHSIPIDAHRGERLEVDAETDLKTDPREIDLCFFGGDDSRFIRPRFSDE